MINDKFMIHEYFPIDDSSSSSVDGDSTEQIVQYEEFFNFIKEDPNFVFDKKTHQGLPTMDSLAFMIESMKQLDTIDWKNEISQIKKHISQIRAESDSSIAFIKSTIYLNKIISNLFTQSVSLNYLKAQRSKDVKMEKFCLLCMRKIELLNNINKILISKNSHANIGSIPPQMLPYWYRDNQSEE